MRRGRGRPEGKSGQAIIFLMVVLVVGLFVVLWNFDLHNTVSTKIRIGHAGDAAALSAARWQGVTINMVGELNLMQAALLLDDPLGEETLDTCAELAEMRSRISLNGPLLGYISAQAAGFMNLKEKDLDQLESDEGSSLSERAAEFMASGDLYRGSVPSPYPGAWAEYGSLLSAIAQGEMLVKSANTSYFFFYDGSHTLLNPEFYHAIASSYWCWFTDSRRSLLSSYSDYGSWPDLPGLSTRPGMNSEYFSTNLKVVNTTLSSALASARSRLVAADSEEADSTPSFWERFKTYVMEEETNPFMADSALSEDQLEINYYLMLHTNLSSVSWHFYGDDWSYGGFMDAYGELFDDIAIKPEFDYTGGADAAVDVYLSSTVLTPGMRIDHDDLRWFAAAKPFGWVEVEGVSAVEKKVPHYFGLVVPAFRQARLIRNDISSRTSGATEPDWEEHIYEHLPEYMSGGPDAISHHDCYYCQQLLTWEDPAFRLTGDTWLQEYHDDAGEASPCYTAPGGGGGGSGGGSDWR